MITADEALDRFDRLWREGQRPALDEFVQAAALSPEQRRDLLPRLIAIDLEYRWRTSSAAAASGDAASADVETFVGAAAPDLDTATGGFGRPPFLEDYWKRWPELLAGLKPSVALAAEEYRVRHRWGDRPAMKDYIRRFGKHPRLIKALQDVQREMQVDANTLLAGVRARNEPSAVAKVEEIVPEPRRFGRYKLLKQLGKGGMGEVWLAEDTQLERRVALKMPRVDQEVPHFKERFVNEAKAAAVLRHAGICPVFDAGEIDGQPFLTMAFIEGATLRQVWDRKSRRSVGKVMPVLAQVARAMQVAHDAGIVHRDLKPSNVMIDTNGDPVVMDFGLAQRATGEGGERITRSGDTFGSPGYMSPEQVEGRTSDIGPASDVYSLGVMLFEALTGRLPFTGAVSAILVHIARDAPPRPSDLQPEIDAELEQLCLEMLSKDPAARPASMNEVAERLQSIQQRLESPGAPGWINIQVDEPSVLTRAHRSSGVRRTKGPRSRSRLPVDRMLIVWVLAGLLAFGLLMAVISSRTSEGTVVIEASPGLARPVTVTILRNGSPLIDDWEIIPGTRNTRRIRTGQISVTLPVELRDEYKIMPLSKEPVLRRDGKVAFRIQKKAEVADTEEDAAVAVPDAFDPDVHREIATWVIRKGGSINSIVDLAGEGYTGIAKAEDLPRGPFCVLGLDFYGRDLTPQDVRVLSQLHQLETLRIEQAELSKEHVQAIAQLKELQRLYLSVTTLTQIDDDEIAELVQALPELVELRAVNFRVQGSFLDELPLRQRRQLASLSLPISAELRPLLPKLRDDLGEALQPVNRHIWLDIAGRELTPELVAGLAQLKPMVQLRLSQTHGLSGHVGLLASLPVLENVYADSAGLDDTDAEQLANFRSLKYLDIRGNAISAEGVQELRAAFPGCHIDADFPEAGPAS